MIISYQKETLNMIISVRRIHQEQDTHFVARRSPIERGCSVIAQGQRAKDVQ